MQADGPGPSYKDMLPKVPQAIPPDGAAAFRIGMGIRAPWCCLLILLAALLAFMPATVARAQDSGSGQGLERLVPDSQAQVLLSFAPVVKRASPAVVNIYTTRRVVQRSGSQLFDDPFFRRFFGEGFGAPFGDLPRERVENSLGSGVIVDPSGVIVTNRHVILGGGDITVALPDRREFKGHVLLTDPDSDLAVLEIETEGEPLPSLELAESHALEVGDLVLAIGNPFGLRQSVTFGIVSAMGRTGISGLGTHSFIQTDAAINPGNSGGALVGLDGRLIGINTLIFSEGGGSDGIGFAIPADLVRAVVADAMEGSGIRRPWLGASGQAVTSDIARSLDLPRPVGVLINGVHPSGSAADAGIRLGDIIVGVDGRTVEDPQALRFHIATRHPGEEIDIEVNRDGRLERMKIRLDQAPEIPPRDLTRLSGRHPLQGAEVGNLSPALALEMGLDPFADGVVITQIGADSTARHYRLQRGDLVVSVNEDSVRLVGDLVRAMEQAGGEWRLRLRRGDRYFNIAVRG